MASNGNFTHQDQYKDSPDQPQIVTIAAATSDSSVTTAGNNNLSKDEVGWYFVEQYYTTLSKSPEKLHLFYSKRSQFVYGLEAQVANVSVGRQAIQERIKALDFQDCKVRVSNVDSQASFDNIVIQVIGETSNKAGEPKKFVQTFVLAQQPSGYFVLNDILRYIDEETDDESAEAAEEPVEEPVEEPEVATEPVAPVEAEAEPVEEVEEASAELDTTIVDEKLEEVSTATKDSATLNGSSSDSAVEDAKVPEVKTASSAASPETTAKQLAEEDAKEVEKPKDPSPTPVAKAAPAAPAAPAAAEPAGPPKPMTWASRIAAAAGPKPVVPLAKAPTPPVPNQTRAPAAAPAAISQPAAAAPVAAPVATATSAAATEAPAKEASGWQTAGSDSKRQNRPQSISGAPTEKEGTLGYVKYVTDKVQEADLRAALAAHGELTYFDINRQKNCAFVEYKTPEGYQTAVAANPHTVNGENIVVEPRRPKANAYGGSSYGATRGGISGRGRGGFEGGNRPGNQGPRGNFSGQGRGRGGAPRGRGGAAAPANNV
ncbi:NTF2 and RRM domain-containing protein [Dactylonectria estremocensis]|uniref:NTF2 and RRM domain-containing protein n=1 Tax=Dactylonectria estremocensis TaxID=1079267 RepID=A0A9P9JKQ0_9HYPO|nr:NTF2 and RRM domain-containing protein [Dactylonectria estremocensis]